MAPRGALILTPHITTPPLYRTKYHGSTHHGADGDVVLPDVLEVERSTAAVLDDRSAGAVVVDDERAVLVGVLLRAVHDVVVDLGVGPRAGPAEGGEILGHTSRSQWIGRKM